MKRIIRKATALTAAAGIFLCAANAGAMTIEYDGKTTEYTGSLYRLFVNNSEMTDLPLEPIIFNDRALVPVREVFEGLGAEVSYDGAEKCVEIEYGTKYIRMYINNNMAYVNGKKTAIPGDVVPKLIAKKGGETKTMVPVRFISETIGLDVQFENDTIFVESQKAIEESKATPAPSATPEPESTSTPKPSASSSSTSATPKPTATVKPSATKKPISERPTGNEEGITDADLNTEFVMQGVDVSHWQNQIDWSKAKDDIDFAILSMGYGQDLTSQDDKQFQRNASECEKYGIPYGVYIYSYALTPERAEGEADHVLRMIKDCNLSFPVYYDLEDDCQANFTPEELGAIAKAFCDKIEAAGYEVGIYANTTWWTNKLTDKVFENPNWYKWVAQYNNKCTYKGKYTMWQYTSSGKVSGMEGDIDMNYWYGKLRTAD